MNSFMVKKALILVVSLALAASGSSFCMYPSGKVLYNIPGTNIPWLPCGPKVGQNSSMNQVGNLPTGSSSSMLPEGPRSILKPKPFFNFYNSDLAPAVQSPRKNLKFSSLVPRERGGEGFANPTVPGYQEPKFDYSNPIIQDAFVYPHVQEQHGNQWPDSGSGDNFIKLDEQRNAALTSKGDAVEDWELDSNDSLEPKYSLAPRDVDGKLRLAAVMSHGGWSRGIVSSDLIGGSSIKQPNLRGTYGWQPNLTFKQLGCLVERDVNRMVKRDLGKGIEFSEYDYPESYYNDYDKDTAISIPGIQEMLMPPELLTVSVYPYIVGEPEYIASKVIDLPCRLSVNTEIKRAKKHDGRTELHSACLNGDFKTVKKLLFNHANVNAALTDGPYVGHTPLHIASIKGNFRIVKELLFKGANVDVAGYDGVTPLYLAVELGHLKIVEALLAKGSNVNVAVKNFDIGRAGWTPLHIAVRKGYVTIVAALLAVHDIDVNAALQSGLYAGITPLHMAAGKGCLKTVHALINAKAIINVARVDGETPLITAAQHGHFEVVKALIDGGADVNATLTSGNCAGLTPLHMASYNKHLPVVKMLLEHGVDPLKVDLTYVTDADCINALEEAIRAK